MNRIDTVHQIAVGDAQIGVTIDASSIQATALVAVIPDGGELVEGDVLVNAGYDLVRLLQAERAIVWTTITGIAAITELIAVAQCV